MKKRALKVALLASACILFWLATAPAEFAVERIVSGGNSTPTTRFIGGLLDWYAHPLAYVARVRPLRILTNDIAELWCSILDPPDTTP